jgi:hypothetical protein
MSTLQKHERMCLADAKVARPGVRYFPCVLCGHTWSDDDAQALSVFAAAHVREHGHEPSDPMLLAPEEPKSK